MDKKANNTINNTINNNIGTYNNIIISVNNVDDIQKITELIPSYNIKYTSNLNKQLEYLNNPHNAIQKQLKIYIVIRTNQKICPY